MGTFSKIKELINDGNYYYIAEGSNNLAGKRLLYFTYGTPDTSHAVWDKEQWVSGRNYPSNLPVSPSTLSVKEENRITSLESFDALTKYRILTSARLGGKLFDFNVGNTIPVDLEEYTFMIQNSQVIIDYHELSSTDNLTTGVFDIKNKLEADVALDPIEIKFVSTFSSVIRKDLVSELRVMIVKQTGDTQFIASQFGIENFFDLESFDNMIKERIQKKIDDNQTKDYPFLNNNHNNSEIKESEKPSKDRMLQIEILQDGFLIDALGTIQNKENVFIPTVGGRLKTKAGLDLAERAGTRKGKIKPRVDGKLSIPFSELKYKDKDTGEQTELYQNPTKIDKVEFYKRIDNNISYDIMYPEYLKAFYQPEEKKTGLIPWIMSFFGGNDEHVSGIDDIILGQWLSFISHMEDDLDDEKIEESIGTVLRRKADEIYLYIFNWISIYYENLIRYNLAKVVRDNDAKDLEDKKGALARAKDNVDAELQGMQGASTFDGLSETDIEQRTKAYKQCVLLLNLQKLKKDYTNILADKWKSSDMHQNDYYNNRFYMIEDNNDPLAIKNKLITPSGNVVKPFMDIKPSTLSELRPRLRFFKIYKDSSKGETYSFEFPFPSFTNTDRAEAFNGTNIDRGDGVGIKSFNFSFDGETPATSQAYINADLTLYFQSFQDFVKERTAPSGRVNNKGSTSEEKFRYVDLFVNTKHCPADPGTTSPLHFDPSYYRLRVDVGWESNSSDSGLNSALESLNKSFYLNLVDHEINIAENGTVTITANYMAFIEGLLDTNNALMSREASKLEKSAIIEYEKAVKVCSNQEELAELRASINAIRVQSKKIIHQALVEKLIVNGCLYYAQVERASRVQFSRKEFFHETPKLLGANKVMRAGYKKKKTTKMEKLPTGPAQEKKWSNILETYVKDPEQDNNERISFFFMSDLVYFLLDSLYEEDHGYEREEQIKLILSSFSMDIPHTKGSTNINIGEIPVEVDVFTNWYKEQIIDKDLNYISFMDFIKRFANYLITDIFNETCINEQQHKLMSFMSSPINTVKKNKKGVLESLLSDSNLPIVDIGDPYKKGVLPMPTSISLANNTNPTNFVQYLLIYPHHKPKVNTGTGSSYEDTSKGIHHLYIGADRGLLKNVSFSKSDIQYIREARMMSQGSNSLLQLSSLYRCSIKMVGNTIFYPGMLLFLNPFGFGGSEFGLPYHGPGSSSDPNLSNIMGIGGYQKVVKVSSSIDESGKFETTLDCIFEHTGEPKDKDAKGNLIPTNSIRQNGNEQQTLPNICSEKIGKVDKSSCRVTEVSRLLQQELFNIKNKGTIDNPELEEEEDEE